MNEMLQFDANLKDHLIKSRDTQLAIWKKYMDLEPYLISSTKLN